MVDDAKASSEKGDYAKALELLQSAGKMPGPNLQRFLSSWTKLKKKRL